MLRILRLLSYVAVALALWIAALQLDLSRNAHLCVLAVRPSPFLLHFKRSLLLCMSMKCLIAVHRMNSDAANSVVDGYRSRHLVVWTIVD